MVTAEDMKVKSVIDICLGEKVFGRIYSRPFRNYGCKSSARSYYCVFSY